MNVQSSCTSTSHVKSFITQTTLIQYNTTQIHFNSTDYPYMYATCFGLYLAILRHVNTQTIHRYNKNLMGPLYIHCFYNVKT